MITSPFEEQDAWFQARRAALHRSQSTKIEELRRAVATLEEAVTMADEDSARMANAMANKISICLQDIEFQLGKLDEEHAEFIRKWTDRYCFACELGNSKHPLRALPQRWLESMLPDETVAEELYRLYLGQKRHTRKAWTRADALEHTRYHTVHRRRLSPPDQPTTVDAQETLDDVCVAGSGADRKEWDPRWKSNYAELEAAARQTVDALCNSMEVAVYHRGFRGENVFTHKEKAAMVQIVMAACRW